MPVEASTNRDFGKTVFLSEADKHCPTGYEPEIPKPTRSSARAERVRSVISQIYV